VCTPTINNIAVNRTLIDGGAGLNIISFEVFKKMQVPYHRLMPTRSFFGVTEGSTMPIGQVRLPVTFGTRDNYRMESLDFDVAYITVPYNAILGYPALDKFMAATHHGFNILKIPSANDTITMRCNEKDALHAGELPSETRGEVVRAFFSNMEIPPLSRAMCLIYCMKNEEASLITAGLYEFNE
jgi:hypothetical protein